uniref:Uncharacterized protein n=1 Tax=Anguilla anguilla TaxID=7936 RepID=A0A0E9RJS2_ANGAN
MLGLSFLKASFYLLSPVVADRGLLRSCRTHLNIH